MALYPITYHEILGPGIHRLVVRAPAIARHHEAGQFVIVRPERSCERIPLTIARSDAAKGTIELIVKVVGKTTAMLCRLWAGEKLADVAGPLGRPTVIPTGNNVMIVGGGVGTAVVYAIGGALARRRNRVTAIIGARTEGLLILESELQRFAESVYVCTDDGSAGFRGTVAAYLATLFASQQDFPQQVFVSGPVPMMRAVASVTKPYGISTTVSLNPIMIDGTGMCGGCRVTVDGKLQFACVDGPEFDGHTVDFDELERRLQSYRDLEEFAYQGFLSSRVDDESDTQAAHGCPTSSHATAGSA